MEGKGVDNETNEQAIQGLTIIMKIVSRELVWNK